MTDELGQTLLYTCFGTTSPHWRLTSDSDALCFALDEKSPVRLAVPLTAPQASLIRSMTGITASVNLTLNVQGETLSLHLVGRKINQHQWKGTASAWGDSSGVARDLQHGLSFAEQVVSEANSVIVIVDRRGNIQRFNRLSEEYTGLKEQEVIGRNVFQLFMTKQEAAASRRNITGFFRNGQSYEVERWVKTKRGQRLFLFRNKFVHSGSGRNEVFLICSGIDITEERRAQERLRVLANTDNITGLPNRNAITQEICEALEQRGDSEVGLVYLDLDNFKKVNDAYGHMFGDQLLQAVSQAILGCLEKEQALARLGGDEFLILAENTSKAALVDLAERILERLKQPFRIGLIEVYSGCSVGIAISPQHGEDRESLIRNADTAMYYAKENGRGKQCVFSIEMNQRAFEYIWLDTNLRKALEQQQLVIHYQPKVDTDGRVTSAEALVRWHSPERGLVAPADFIPYAEESGLIVPLGRWVLLSVITQLAEWRRKGIPLRIAVNVSPRQLMDHSLYNDLKQALDTAGLQDCPLDIELTESCLIENEDQVLALMQLFRQLGAQIHLDDFGTGYSSLSQLTRFPINAIKLDQSFIRGVNLQPVSQSLVRAIVAVARALDLCVIAEGIETVEEDKFVIANGVNARQGFLHAKPMPAEALEHWLKHHSKP
ncbi:cyclic di-GMP phosphodiesterase [Erwinia sp. OLTSP20]|uniref:cyclic di-GMP phosphodiesterase n=1 Tax=unclassified Erwinia TaxID=2622719 RepID=UPI000C187F6D|nr:MULTISPECIES: cyclic di-GMP phosphodiesterase [unclassified Erwinia]PIJ51791.1 cyclic di-GMP phosphodiesterase [Erwinia sp. OAMSP11]PIJ74380.1 cyclic di-GMP phosphodiesterase [Erwinia sp. OLSSP12]PIJ83787.1 cyclic di-GMP phosphodiesterase [Erwinia sp. OLCASP19]PIJ86830.1 cyclic di-GMP phosphodiesterase [Erwinia sp. OLMTSP26]PIJ88237.1 cyclic di-GMP phosphodiesterase [Erwinia sp. OLMDSP33]